MVTTTAAPKKKVRIVVPRRVADPPTALLSRDEEIWWITRLLASKMPTPNVRKRITTLLKYSAQTADVLIRTARTVLRSRLLDREGRDPYSEIVDDMTLVRSQCIQLIQDPEQSPDIKSRARKDLIRADHLLMNLTGVRAPVRLAIGHDKPPLINSEMLFEQPSYLSQVVDADSEAIPAV